MSDKVTATRMARGIRVVVLEHDGKDGTRVRTKPLSNNAAKRLYGQLLAAGKTPKIVSADV